MAIKSILIHLDNNKDCEQRVILGNRLARQFGAQVHGLYIKPAATAGNNMDLTISQAYVGDSAIAVKSHSDAVKNDIQNIQALLQKHPSPSGETMAWQVGIEDSAQVLADHSHFHDLLIISADLENDHILSLLSDAAPHIAINASCPVLVLPSAVDVDTPGDKPLVAWDGSRNAARAAKEALPFLQKSGSVTVLAGDRKALGEDRNKLAPLRNYFAAHQVQAQFLESEYDHHNTGDSVLKMVEEQSYDFVVMGAYGHSQLRELFFGSSTRDIVDKSPVPVLLCH